MSSLSDSTADRLQDIKPNSKDSIYIDEDEVEGSGRGGEVSWIKILYSFTRKRIYLDCFPFILSSK